MSFAVGYLEIVTPDVDTVCEIYAAANGVEFSGPVAELGGARMAVLSSGRPAKVGIRAPMRDTEAPVVRPYLLVDDAAAAIEAVRAKGAEIAVPPMEIPGQGTCAIYLLGGVEHGIWQNP